MNSLRTFRVLSLAIAVAGLAAHAIAAPATTQAERDKQNAAGIANTLANVKLNIDSSQGKGAVGSANTEQAMRGSLTQFQDISGIKGVDQQSSHTTSGSKDSRMSINVDSGADYQCANPRKTISAGGLFFKLLSCDTNTKALAVAVCDNATKAGLCSTDKDYSAKLILPHGQYTDWKGMKLGVACNTTGSCRLTVKGAYALGGNDESLKKDAEKANSSSSSVGSTLSGAMTKGDYTSKMMEYGKPLKECSDKNATAMDKGQAINCGENGEVVTFANKKNPNSPKCDTQSSRKCIKYEKNSLPVTKSCTRSFDLTERVTKLQYNSSAVCTVTEKIDPKTQKSSFVDSCFVDNEDSRAGKTRIGDSTRNCTKTGKLVDKDGKEYGNDVCLAFTHTEYWLAMQNQTVKSVVDRPTAVTGACTPLTGNGDSLCPDNNWFGRLLPQSACQVSITDGFATGDTNIIDIDFRAKNGCGVCMTPTVSQVCYGAPLPNETADNCDALAKDKQCVLTSVVPLTQTGEGSGLVASQQENYSCVKETPKCVEWEATKDGCYEEDMAAGFDKLQFKNDGFASFSNALVAAGTLDSVGSGVDSKDGANAAVPKIFNGDDNRCDRASGGMVGNLLSRNCCRKDLERPKPGMLIRAGCDIDDVRLAAARRSNYTTYIGEYCSKKAFWGTCLRKTETYCTFPGILPRLVHEQGRQQLLDIAASSGAQMQASQMSFNYYGSGQGNWSSEVNVNGNKVRAWQWPSYCKDPAEAGKMMVSDPNANTCAGGVTTWFAVCTTGNCEALDSSPENGALSWDLMNVNPLDSQTSALNRYTIAKGGCTADNRCSYEVKAWPIGVGGKVVVTKNMTWTLYEENPQGVTNAVNAPAVYQMANVGDFMFKGFSMRGSGGLPATVRMDFSSDGGQTWTSFQVPTNSPHQEMSLGASGVTIIGSCDAQANMCGYSMTGTTTVTAKPWGPPKNPDCTGFTAGQLAALDFGRMDLSEWLETVIDKATGNMSQDELVEQAKGQFQAYNSIYSGGEVSQTQSSTRASNFARALPAEGFGPFDVKLVVSGIWPEAKGNPAVDTDLVTRVTVDWGDCSVPQELPRIPSTEPGNGFRGVHRYEAPDSYACLGNPRKNVTHKVKLTAYTTRSGVQNRTVSVENAWSTYPGGKANNDHVNETVTATPGGGAPASPSTEVLRKK